MLHVMNESCYAMLHFCLPACLPACLPTYQSIFLSSNFYVQDLEDTRRRAILRLFEDDVQQFSARELDALFFSFQVSC